MGLTGKRVGTFSSVFMRARPMMAERIDLATGAVANVAEMAKRVGSGTIRQRAEVRLTGARVPVVWPLRLSGASCTSRTSKKMTNLIVEGTMGEVLMLRAAVPITDLVAPSRDRHHVGHHICRGRSAPHGAPAGYEVNTGAHARVHRLLTNRLARHPRRGCARDGGRRGLTAPLLASAGLAPRNPPQEQPVVPAAEPGARGRIRCPIPNGRCAARHNARAGKDTGGRDVIVPVRRTSQER